MGEKNESFYDNIILESIINIRKIPICGIENTPETPLTGTNLTYHQKTLKIHQKTWKMYGPYQSKIPIKN